MCEVNVIDRFEAAFTIGDRMFVVLPNDDGLHFLCPVEYTGYTLEVDSNGKEYTHYARELDFNGNVLEDEEIVDPGLLRWTEFEALEAFKIAHPGEVVLGILHQPSLEDVALAAGV